MQIDPDALSKRWERIQRTRAMHQAIAEDELTDREIAERFGVARGTVRRHRAKIGLTRATRVRRQAKRKQKVYHPRVIQAVVEAYQQGYTIQQMHEATGIQVIHLSHLLQQQGIEPRKVKRTTRQPKQYKYKLGPQKRKEQEQI